MIAVFAMTCITIGGCSGDTSVSPVITKEQVDADHAQAIKNIDNNPNLSAKDKENIKSHIGLGGAGADRSAAEAAPPAGKK